MMGAEGAEQRWGSRVRVSDMGVFGLSPAASSPAMASPVTGLSGLTLSLSLSLCLSLLAKPRVLWFRGSGGRANEGDEGQRKGAGYERVMNKKEKVN